MSVECWNVAVQCRVGNISPKKWFCYFYAILIFLDILAKIGNLLSKIKIRILSILFEYYSNIQIKIQNYSLFEKINKI
jgi:hypothetical protein